MLFSRNKITTNSTIEETSIQVSTWQTTLQPSKIKYEKAETNRPQRSVLILEENFIKKSHKIQQNWQKQIGAHSKSQNFRSNNLQRQKKCDIKILTVLQNIFFKKKRYVFQVLKQFYLFPDDSQSSISNLSAYDPLIFQDEIIHTFVKKMETKIIQNKIWGFLNLKLRPYIKAAATITKVTQNIFKRGFKMQKRTSFNFIKKASQDFISSINQNSCFQINSNLSLENKGIQSFIDLKKIKSRLSSNVIQQKVKLALNQRIQESKSQSLKKFYLRQENELKDISQKKESIQNRNGFNKFNIIHYHQRPRQIVDNKIRLQFHSYSQNQCFEQSSDCYCCHCCECCSLNCQSHVNQIHSYCCSNSFQNPSTFKGKSQTLNQTAITQKTNNLFAIKKANQIQKIYNNSNYQLSQLQSRIQYLNFLRKIVKQQEESK